MYDVYEVIIIKRGEKMIVNDGLKFRLWPET